MDERWQSLTEAALLLAAIFAVVAFGIIIVRRFRDGKADDVQESSQLMSKFRDLHDEGGLSDEEFRNIKTKLATKLKAELNETSQSSGPQSAGSPSTES
ncbi:hypothetical protein [Bythopirellula polymerisocia]|uniref:SHOCT domain-containing protein n=1 Tax=Bythopirellula polymerisocia TaxID=2528003 RepID=A0A5C6CCP6_9BACT|nr:hypothetical protein [Bythopirellula polymerisocia]TWU21882.1 hypothetical protein Pla144_43160 [Bythopirellula polymerisocia]